MTYRDPDLGQRVDRAEQQLGLHDARLTELEERPHTPVMPTSNGWDVLLRFGNWARRQDWAIFVAAALLAAACTTWIYRALVTQPLEDEIQACRSACERVGVPRQSGGWTRSGSGGHWQPCVCADAQQVVTFEHGLAHYHVASARRDGGVLGD
jgi:hypothetical protein